MTGKRSAPVIAAQNSEQARQNIEAKLKAIEAVLSQKAPSASAVKALPTSTRQFNHWHTGVSSLVDRVPDVALRSNGPQTLRAMKVHRGLVEDAVKRVARAAQTQEKRGPEFRLVRLQERIELAEKLRKIAEQSVALLTDQLEKAQAEIRRLSAQLQSTVDEANREVKEMEAALAEERRKVGDLTHTLRKTTRLKDVK